MDQAAETKTRFEVSYTITPDAMLDASRLYRATFLRIVTSIVAVLTILGIALVIIGEPGVGVWMVIFGVVGLFSVRFPFLDRWMIQRSARGLIGETMTYDVDDTGIHYRGPTSSGLMPWSSFTSVRADEKSIAFARDRVVPAYVPASAFASPEERGTFLAFARAHINASPGRAD
jgi:hypothetical protein